MNPSIPNATEAVTVIVCCYNAEVTIAETLASLQAQSLAELEILVIDDGSTDGAADTVRVIARQDSRVRLLVNDRNRGTAWTRQRGLTEATHELVMFLDADDIAERDLVARLTQTMLSDPDLLGVGCHARYVDDNGAPLGVQRIGPVSRRAFEAIYSDNKLLFMLVTTLFRRAEAQAVGGYRLDLMPNPEGIRYEDFSEDVDLWCRMSDLGADGRYFVSIPEVLFRYRKPLGSLSTQNLGLMQLKMRWIKDCLIRRRAGGLERPLSEFIASRTWIERINDRRSNKAAEFYRKAGFAYSMRKFSRMVIYLGLTAMISPKLVLQKLRTQSVLR